MTKLQTALKEKAVLENRVKHLEAQMLSTLWAGVHLWGERFALDYNHHLIRQEIKSKAKASKGGR